MYASLAEVLRLPSFRAAGTRVLTGDPDAIDIRWVHSSEVYEMSGLLAGGELLLTTGLGLHGANAEQLDEYVTSLARAGCAALALELGRSFLDPPEAMVDAARRAGLAFLVFPRIVPFVRMVEDFHELAVRARLGAAEEDAGWAGLLDLVVEGAGPQAVLDQLARIAGCAAELLDPDGHVVEQSRISTVRLYDGAGATAQLRSRHRILGTVRLLCGTPDARLNRLADRAATALTLELARHREAGWRPTLSQALVSDLNAGALLSHDEIARRLEDAGLVTTGRRITAIAADPHGDPGACLSRVEAAWPALVGPLVAGTLGHLVVVLLITGPSTTPRRLRELLREGHQSLGTSGVDVTIGAAMPCDRLTDLPAALHTARDVVRLADARAGDTRVLLARDVGVQRLVAGGLSADRIDALVAEQLGPLLASDRHSQGSLVSTLDAYLALGRSKTLAAQRLGIRRQSLYARLERIERSLGISLEDAESVLGLHVALVAWRLRTGIDPAVGVSPGGARM
ncbi:helix-turn-helix domain-containing protein [Aeromicrobium piscarium]|uniref:PucR family transcriptional regulator n=1 Tax=Aeromicrobium piscarium TaxID=2590901 RepID=A0A554SGB9_9ACTN|nr:PucR family transcriptional regulator [Aeromicrobium piscarium]TSD65391.1 PucR family transcriptional regulator [Aeromicrobium piscarium]